ncbi:MAG: site-2 protease family protein, partial [Kiritimatiellae bacterium]|nr:site-2 protease family protein [Kiritimatiellia bacterium]
MFLVFILLIVLLFGVSVFVHELGHFLVARALGLQATVFSIGMGPAIWKRQLGPTRLQIGCLPIGGFVALPQMDPNSFLESGSAGDPPAGGAGVPPADSGSAGGPPASDSPSPLPPHSSLLTPSPPVPPVPPWKKLLVALAGAFGNLLFALLLGVVVWLVGRPASLQETTATVGYVATPSPAADAGLAPGDT